MGESNSEKYAKRNMLNNNNNNNDNNNNNNNNKSYVPHVVCDEPRKICQILPLRRVAL